MKGEDLERLLIWRQFDPIFGSPKDYNENDSVRRGKQTIR